SDQAPLSVALGLHVHGGMPLWAWLVFAAIVLVSVSIDLFGHRGERGKGTRGALAWSIGWICVALAFAAGGWAQFGRSAGQDFLTAYLVEKSLSLDNLFVFLVVFTRLRIPEKEQHRVLFWGILGAFVTRAVFIAAGTTLLHAWHGVTYVLGAFLVF